MKIFSIVIVALALAAGILYFALVPRSAPAASVNPAPDLAQPLTPIAPAESRPVSLSQPDPTENLLREMERILARLERLEGTVSEVRTEISIRSEERSRVTVAPVPTNGRLKLDDDDLTTLRTLIREGLVNEAWKHRQAEIVDIGRHLALQLGLETRVIDPMVEVLCVDGLPLFNLERELADQNHDKTLAKRRLRDFKLARRRLREDLGSTLGNEELAARVFLHVVSSGEVASISMDRERLLATEKDWLR